jgi:putative ABC transport system substrate-binding protein
VSGACKLGQAKAKIPGFPEGRLGSFQRIARRGFTLALAAAAWLAWPAGALAQQRPVIGFINPTSPDGYPHAIAAFREGLKEAGFVEGHNVTIEYRWAHGRNDRLPALAADLVQRKVDVIAATGGDSAALAAKSATTAIPIVFNSGGDPVRVGLVASLNRPGSNLTGVSRLNTELLPKRLELISQVVPKGASIGLLSNRTTRTAEPRIKEVQAAGRSLGRQIHLLEASSGAEIDGAFLELVQAKVGALLIVNDSFFNARSVQLGTLALRHAVPAIFQNREFAAAGGLMSYGPSLAAAYRTVGVYTGRVLKGAKPSDLPVQQQTTVDFYINLRTARALGLTIPLPLQGLASELIE